MLAASVMCGYNARAQSATISTLGFEDGTLGGFGTQDASELDSLSYFNTNNIRTGVYGNKMYFKTASTPKWCFTNSAYLPSGSSASYVHATCWEKLTTGDASAVGGFISFRTTTATPPLASGSSNGLSSLSSGTATALNGSTWTQVHYGVAVASTFNMFPCFNRNGAFIDSIFVDDIVLYTSSSATDDIIAPSAATLFTATSACTSVNLAWTPGVDDITNAGYTGVRNTFILRTSVLTANAPSLHNQGQYSTTGGSAGPDSVNDGTGKWTIISTTTGATAGTYTDNPGNGSYKYAVIMQDYAYNYSTAAISSTVTLAPAPTVSVSIANQNICNNAPTTAINFTPSASATYIWTSDNTSTGLSATGITNIPSFTATNSTNAPITATVTVTPYLGVCAGASQTSVLVVNPTPTVTATPSSQTICNGNINTVVGFSGNVGTATYNWTNNTPTIGITGSGAGNIGPFTAVNAGTTQILDTITVTPVINGCTGTAQQATIFINPSPVVTSTPSRQQVCNGAASTAIVFGTSVAATTSYSWVNNTPAIGLAASNTGNVPTFSAVNTGTAPITAIITVTPTATGCAGAAKTDTIIVNPTPTVSVNTAAQTICNGAPTGAINFSSLVTGTSYAWTNTTTSINLAATGTTNIGSFTAVNTGTTAVTATITVTPTANGCVGPTQTPTITVSPTPIVTATPASQPVCNGLNSGTIVFSSSVANTNYTWTNDNTSTGLMAGNSTSSVAPFTAINTGNSSVVSNVTITPVANGCTGIAQIATITVNPTPVANISAPGQSVCNNTQVTALNFSSNVTGATTTYAWTNSVPAIGTSGSGTGNINAFTGLNATSTAVVANISVTPTANGCTGAPTTTTITIKPTPVATATPASQPVCSGNPTGVVTFTSTVTGSTYAWSSTNTSTGITSPGITNTVPVFTGVNITNVPVTSTITVIPTANGCAGVAQTATITINPIPTVTALPSSQVKCNNTATSVINFTSNVSGATYAWTNNTSGTGLAASGANSSIGSVTALNAGTTPVTAIITVVPTANGCPGIGRFDTVVMNPTPAVTVSLPQTVCNGTTTSPVTFSGSPVANTSYNWTNNNTAIGLAASNSGNIGTFNAINTTATVAAIATITVTPVANSCPGTPQTTSITVNPTPNVGISQPSQPVCATANTTQLFFGSTTTGTIFNWTNSNANIGLSATTGTGTTIPSFITINTGTTPIQDTITVTPVAFGCVGAKAITTITVNPIPTVVATPLNQSVCNNAPANITFTSPVAGTTYNWTNNNTSAGLGASGTNNISFTAKNTGIVPIAASISVIPVANGCAGGSQYATIIVNPTPTVVATPATQSGCTGASTTPVTFSGTVSGTSYFWANNNTSTGLGLNGSVSIPSFTTTNTTQFQNVATVTVTPVANGCAGQSQPVTITVNPYPIAVTSASANTTSCSNDSVILNSNTGTTFSYQWLFNNAVIPNAINAIYYAHHTGTYSVKINSRGCVSTSNGVPVIIKAIPPAPIYNIGGSLALCPGDSVILGTVTAYNPSYTYQWQSNGNDIPGATNVSYTTQGVGNYDVRVISGACANTSAVLTVTANPAPPISGSISAANSAVCPGGSDLLHFDTSSYAYQWYRNNVIIHGATTSNYNATSAGSYTVGLTTSLGCTAFTGVETITMGTIPAPVIVQADNQLCTQLHGTYQWYLNGTAITGQTGSCITPGTQAGCYTVVVTNASQCVGESKPFCYSTAVNNVTPAAVKLYPNPATNIVNISAPESVNVTINSLDGKQLIYVEHATTIDISKLANTIYLIKMYGKNNTLIKVEKLVKTGW